jgi:hypothetical protein
MARLTRQIAGLLSGRIGDIIFKQSTGGRSYSSARPRKSAKIPSAEVLAHRAQFKTSVVVANAIYKESLLKNLWPVDNVNHISRFQKMVKTNYHMINAADLSGNLSLTPDIGFNLQNASLQVAVGSITLTANALGTQFGVDTEVEKFVTAVGLIILKDPDNPVSKKLDYIPIRTGQADLDSDTPLSLITTLTQEEQDKIARYAVKRVFLSLLTLNSTGSAVRYSAALNS